MASEIPRVSVFGYYDILQLNIVLNILLRVGMKVEI